MRPEELEQLYDATTHLLEKRHIPLNNFQLYQDEYDDEAGVIVFSYQPQKSDELDVTATLSADDFARVAIGPFEFFPAIDIARKDMPEQFAAAIQGLLNGQMAVVLTERARDRHWQAAELVFTDKSAKPITIATIKNNNWGRGTSQVRVLRNNLTGDHVDLSENFMLPQMVNKKFIRGRMIDLHHVTPLTKKQFAKIEASEAVQQMGGAPGQADWMVFYRHIEFWIICVLVGVPAVWLSTLIPEENGWQYEALRSSVGAIAGSIITGMSYVWLTARQAKIDRGEVPLFDSDTWYVSPYMLLILLALPMIWVVYFAPIWTPLSDPKHLYAGITQTKQLVLINSSVALMLGGLMFVRGARPTRAVRFVLFSAGYALLMYINYALFASSDTSSAAESPLLPTLFVTIVPAGIILWLLFDALRKTAIDDPMKRDW